VFSLVFIVVLVGVFAAMEGAAAEGGVVDGGAAG
jgi:hypothetical protein